MIRRSGVAVSTFLAAGALALAAALPATAAQAGPPNSGDPRATAYPGNADTCQAAGLDGDKVSVVFLTDATGRFVTIISVPSDIELTGTVVNGGPGYNVYPPDARPGLHAPLTESGNIPGIRAWFACGEEKPTTTTPTPTTTTHTTTTTTDTTTTTTTDTTTSDTTSSDTTTTESTTTTTPGGGGGGGDDDGLADTGFEPRGLLVAGGALLLIGAGLVLGIRRTRGQHSR